MTTHKSDKPTLIGLLNHHLLKGDLLENEWMLARALGYRKPFQIHQWSTGKAKVPLEKLASLTEHIGMQLHETIPLWLRQELESQADTRLIQAAKFMVSPEEFTIISAARDCYVQAENPQSAANS